MPGSIFRLLSLTIGLLLIFTFSFLPIFYDDVKTAAAPAFNQLGYNHRYKSTTHGDSPKYFHEAKDGGALHHYDGRFQHGILPDPHRRDAQTHMVRAYHQFAKMHELETWLAHGTLLGWWWNAKLLPWDNDIDVQMSLESLQHMAVNYNQSVFDYSSDTIEQVNPPPPTPTETVNLSYLLDINPAYASRSHGNGDNVIDGRFIDMRNGLYIDLTAVSENEPSTNPDRWTDKNEHEYRTEDLYPLRATLFEGVMTKIPCAYVRVLTDEYKEKALVVTEYEGHRWNAETLLWTKKTSSELKHDREEAAKKKAEENARKNGAKAAKAKAKAQAQASQAAIKKEKENYDPEKLKALNRSRDEVGEELADKSRRGDVTEERGSRTEAEEAVMNWAKRK